MNRYPARCERFAGQTHFLYFKERYRKEKEKYKTTKELAEQGDPQAIELLAEYDRRIAIKKKQGSERQKKLYWSRKLATV